MPTMKHVLRLELALCMVGAGLFTSSLHSGSSAPCRSSYPRRPALIFISGIFEILGGFGLLVPLTRQWAGWGLVALYAAVVPANLNTAVNRMSI